MQKILTGDRCQCPTCGHCFNSDTGFDRHRVGRHDDDAKPRRCLSVPEMEAKGYSRNARGWWITKRRPAMVATA